jgi:hypothetical protein
VSDKSFGIVGFHLVSPFIDRSDVVLAIPRDKPSVVTTDFSDTEIKLGEATFFLDLIEQNAAHQAILFYGLSAFLAAGRSITLYLQAEASPHPGFEEWYKQIQEELKLDELMRFFKNTRDGVLHARYSKIRTVFDVPLYKDGEQWIHRPSDPIHSGFSFDDFLTENGFKKCRDFLEKMKKIISEAKARGFLPNDNARRISLQATDLGKPRMFEPR